MNEFEEAEEFENLPEEFGGPSKRAKITWKILRVVGWVIFCAVLGVLFSRMCSTSNDPKSMSTVTPNEKLVSVYQAQGGEVYAYTQNLDKFTRGDKNYGYFHIGDAIFIDEADQIQFTLKYNNSTIEHLVIDHKLPMLPARSEDLYDVSIVVMYDLTPDNKEDNYGDVEDAVSYKRFFPSDCISAEKTVYNYRKFVFDGIDITNRVLAVYVDIYYKGAVDYDEEPYGTLLIYDYETKNETYKAEPFPEFVKNIIDSDGLLNSLKKA